MRLISYLVTLLVYMACAWAVQSPTVTPTAATAIYNGGLNVVASTLPTTDYSVGTTTGTVDGQQFTASHDVQETRVTYSPSAGEIAVLHYFTVNWYFHFTTSFSSSSFQSKYSGDDLYDVSAQYDTYPSQFVGSYSFSLTEDQLMNDMASFCSSNSVAFIIEDFAEEGQLGTYTLYTSTDNPQFESDVETYVCYNLGYSDCYWRVGYLGFDCLGLAKQLSSSASSSTSSWKSSSVSSLESSSETSFQASSKSSTGSSFGFASGVTSGSLPGSSSESTFESSSEFPSKSLADSSLNVASISSFETSSVSPSVSSTLFSSTALSSSALPVLKQGDNAITYTDTITSVSLPSDACSHTTSGVVSSKTFTASYIIETINVTPSESTPTSTSTTGLTTTVFKRDATGSTQASTQEYHVTWYFNFDTNLLAAGFNFYFTGDRISNPSATVNFFQGAVILSYTLSFDSDDFNSELNAFCSNDFFAIQWVTLDNSEEFPVYENFVTIFGKELEVTETALADAICGDQDVSYGDDCNLAFSFVGFGCSEIGGSSCVVDQSFSSAHSSFSESETSSSAYSFFPESDASALSSLSFEVSEPSASSTEEFTSSSSSDSTSISSSILPFSSSSASSDLSSFEVSSLEISSAVTSSAESVWESLSSKSSSLEVVSGSASSDVSSMEYFASEVSTIAFPSDTSSGASTSSGVSPSGATSSAVSEIESVSSETSASDFLSAFTSESLSFDSTVPQKSAGFSSTAVISSKILFYDVSSSGSTDSSVDASTLESLTFEASSPSTSSSQGQTSTSGSSSVTLSSSSSTAVVSVTFTTISARSVSTSVTQLPTSLCSTGSASSASVSGSSGSYTEQYAIDTSLDSSEIKFTVSWLIKVTAIAEGFDTFVYYSGEEYQDVSAVRHSPYLTDQLQSSYTLTFSKENLASEVAEFCSSETNIMYFRIRAASYGWYNFNFIVGNSVSPQVVAQADALGDLYQLKFDNYLEFDCLGLVDVANQCLGLQTSSSLVFDSSIDASEASVTLPYVSSTIYSTASSSETDLSEYSSLETPLSVTSFTASTVSHYSNVLSSLEGSFSNTLTSEVSSSLPSTESIGESESESESARDSELSASSTGSVIAYSIHTLESSTVSTDYPTSDFSFSSVYSGNWSLINSFSEAVSTWYPASSTDLETSTASSSSISQSDSANTETSVATPWFDGSIINGQPHWNINIPGSLGPWASVYLTGSSRDDAMHFTDVHFAVDGVSAQGSVSYSDTSYAGQFFNIIDENSVLVFSISSKALTPAPYTTEARVTIANADGRKMLLLVKRAETTYALSYTIEEDADVATSASSTVSSESSDAVSSVSVSVAISSVSSVSGFSSSGLSSGAATKSPSSSSSFSVAASEVTSSSGVTFGSSVSVTESSAAASDLSVPVSESTEVTSTFSSTSLSSVSVVDSAASSTLASSISSTDSIHLSSEASSTSSLLASVTDTTSSTLVTESTTTVDQQSTTVITITSCSNNGCLEVTATTGLTVITATSSGIVTEYTTYCPLTTESTSTVSAGSSLSTKAIIVSPDTITIITVISCSSSVCSETPVSTGLTIVTTTSDGVVTEYTTFCPLSRSSGVGGSSVTATSSFVESTGAILSQNGGSLGVGTARSTGTEIVQAITTSKDAASHTASGAASDVSFDVSTTASGSGPAITVSSSTISQVESTSTLVTAFGGSTSSSSPVVGSESSEEGVSRFEGSASSVSTGWFARVLASILMVSLL